MADNRNPALPRCEGALLAEEWSIDPLSPLPSFLEMVMIAEAARSTRKSLQYVTDTIERYLRNLMISEDPLFFANSGSAFLVSAEIRLRRSAQVLTIATQRILNLYAAEIRLLTTYILERKVLFSSGASSAESIYGTVRAKIRPSTTNRGAVSVEKLTAVDRTRSALILAIGPYLEEKFVRYGRRLSVTMQRNDHGTIAHLALTHWPLLQAGLDCARMFLKWQYFVGNSLYFDFPSLLVGSIVRRRTQQDTPSEIVPDSPSEGSLQAIQERSPVRALSAFLVASTAFSWITVLRREAVSTRGQHENANANSMPSLRPPPEPTFFSSIAHGKCPICRQNRTDPTAGPSGHVYCHQCLVAYVRKHGRCPVTDEKCRESSLIRIYEPFEDMNDSA